MKKSKNILFFRIFTGISVLLVFSFAFLICKDIYTRKQENSKAEKKTLSEEYASKNSIQETEIKQKKHIYKTDLHTLLLLRTHQKEGVFLDLLEKEVDTAGIIAVHVYHQILGDSYTPWITSGNDFENHVKNSKHYQNKALDFRLKGIPNQKKLLIVEDIKKALGNRFSVFHENKNGDTEHLHIEWKK